MPSIYHSRDTDETQQPAPLKYETGAEVAKSIVIDYGTIPRDDDNRRLVYKGELFCQITTSEKYAPYSKLHEDGRESVAADNCVITKVYEDAQLGDVGIGGWMHNCAFDLSELDTHGLSKHGTSLTALKAAFPTCVFED